MAKVDAVIAALRTVLQDAEQRTDVRQWDIQIINRWLKQLPGAWAGRWRHLRLRPPYGRTSVWRNDFIGHLKATLAYLEDTREAPDASTT